MTLQEPRFIPYRPERLPIEEMRARAASFERLMDGRRTVRQFSTDPVPRDLVESAIRVASTAPSGAHKQPWTYVAVSNADLKRRLREVAEKEEWEFYHSRIPEEWRADLAPLGTDWVKTHLTDAPWVVVVFAQDYALRPDGTKGKHYYVNESVGISVGFFLAALRSMGLVSLTHTPSPMGFLRDLFGRPPNERAYVVLPVGYPHPDCQVPDLSRKPLAQVSAFLE